MACRVKDTTPLEGVYELLSEQGFAGMREAVEKLLNEVTKLERAAHLGAEPYERTGERRGYANGYKPKRVRTSAGGAGVSGAADARGRVLSGFSGEGLRSEQALRLALAEMYVQGRVLPRSCAVWRSLRWR